MQDIAGVILAAGKGTRIGGTLPKVLNPIAGKPMISYTLELLKSIPIEHVFAVVGYKAQDVIANVGAATIVRQDNPMGTADALNLALKSFTPDLKYALVMNGDDSAFYEVSTIRALIHKHIDEKASASLLTLNRSNPNGLGRIVRGEQGEILRIVEEKAATEDEKKIHEVNIGCYFFSIEWLESHIDKVQKSASGEYYITDLIGLAIDEKSKVSTLTLEDESQWMGVNTIEELEKADAAMFARLKQWKKPKVFFFDVDHTLLNTEKLKEAFTTVFERVVASDLKVKESAAELSKKFWTLYTQMSDKAGFVSIPAVCVAFAELIGQPEAEAMIKSMFLTLPFGEYLYPDAVELLEYCSHCGSVVIISNGDNVYQPAKIQALGLEKYISDQFIYQVKLDHMKDFFEIYKDYELWSINDNIVEQEAFEKYNPEAQTIRIKQGKYVDLKPTTAGYKPKYTVTSLKEIRDILHSHFA